MLVWILWNFTCKIYVYFNSALPEPCYYKKLTNGIFQLIITL